MRGKGSGRGGYLSFLGLRSGVVLPYISNILGMCHPKGQVFAPFWSENGYGFLGNYESV